MKLCLIHFNDLDEKYYGSANYFNPLFEFITAFVEEKDPRALDNPNTNNHRLAQIILSLRYLTLHANEKTAENIKKLFSVLYPKIDSQMARFRILNDIITSPSDYGLSRFRSLGSEVIHTYTIEVRKEIARDQKSSLFYRKDIFDSIYLVLDTCEKEGYLLLVEGIKSFLTLINTIFELVWEEGQLKNPARLASIKKSMKTSCFEKMSTYLEAKLKDVKGVLSSE